ncbi:MAG: N-formylglutamate amidohydrolase [Deltaproteobacteria bacterium]|nr:N-formylglutamate amidohydrolase [Deltaproteobacteria bacterium]
MGDCVDYRADDCAPFEFVKVTPNRTPLCPEEYRSRIMVHTVHDGDVIPDWILSAPQLKKIVRSGELCSKYTIERDWGANIVAQCLAETLGLAGYYRVTTARMVMDFNRFPGSSPPDALQIDRMAIIQPLSHLLDHDQKRLILEKYYDQISHGMEAALDGKLLFLGIHSYDEHNASLTQRPEVSILTRALSYQQRSRLPYNQFDPLFPDVLAESSAHRVLRDRLALTLEKSGLLVEHNYPYCLPDGSLEIRSQPWLFFREVRRRFNSKHAETIHDPAFELVWEMLLNTNLRLADAEALSGYLHRFRKAPGGRETEFSAARAAYDQIHRFVKNRPQLVGDYRNYANRTSAIGVEVRKDLVWEFDGLHPIQPREHKAREIASKLALGVAEYLVKDR